MRSNPVASDATSPLATAGWTVAFIHECSGKSLRAGACTTFVAGAARRSGAASVQASPSTSADARKRAVVACRTWILLVRERGNGREPGGHLALARGGPRPERAH